MRRAGLERPPRPQRAARSRNLGSAPPPRIFLPGEADDAGPIDLAALSGRVAPVELEIGTGKGRFLFRAAAANRDRNYVGIEIEPEYAAIAQQKAGDLGLGNVKILPFDGKAFVMRRLSSGSLAALHVFFPDPWPKKRHKKRRLFDAPFAAAAAVALRPGGLLRVASDHVDYWSVIQEVLGAEPLLARLSDEEAGPWATETNYEQKFLKTGRPIHKAVYRRR
jgi:tRNA (guanine-N7-)-methyltransferase